QFQVVLKPAPDDVQQIYLESLEACGINPRQHDIRFEEDNWESPTLGAWGIGWQVLFDGMEITQFTYFQQADGFELAPISAELTYGLERIAMVLQKVDSIFDLEWAPGVKYADVRHREEVEQSKYAFNVGIELPAGQDFASLHRRLYDDNYTLAEALLKAGLVMPALEHTLKCSHLFNILDASNSIGVTERTAFILNIRKLALNVAKLYVEQTSGASRVEAPGAGGEASADGPGTAVGDRDRGTAGELAAGADQSDWRDRRRLVESAAPRRRVAGRNVQHAAATHRTDCPRPRAADRSRGAGHRTARQRGVQAGRRRHAGGRGLCDEARRRRRRARARADAERRVPRVPQASARPGGDRCAARRARRHAARPLVS